VAGCTAEFGLRGRDEYLALEAKGTRFLIIIINNIIGIRMTINPVKTQQFILLFSTTCCGLKANIRLNKRT
jgi:hypothetical protein